VPINGPVWRAGPGLSAYCTANALSDMHHTGQGDGKRNDEGQQNSHVDGHCGQILVWLISVAIIRICTGKQNGVRDYVGNRWKQ
jgi:hypothetical protein